MAHGVDPATLDDTAERIDRLARRAQRLRWLCFMGSRGAPDSGDVLDADAHDTACSHVLVEEARSGTLVCCFRLLPLESGRDIGASYAAQHYNLARLEVYDGRMVEMGRFCIHPEWTDPEILRVAWAALALHVEAEGVQLLFGCSSFIGTDPEVYLDAFAMLRSASQDMNIKLAEVAKQVVDHHNKV